VRFARAPPGRRSTPTLDLMRFIALCEAKCKRCRSVFGHASLGDHAYGEAVLSTEDGSRFVLASAMTEMAERVRGAIPASRPRMFWPVLAAIADPIGGMRLTEAVVCPHCQHTDLEYWGGRRLGETAVPEATFLRFSQLSSRDLALRITKCWRRAREV
jgi:hypothetical protein